MFKLGQGQGNGTRHIIYGQSLQSRLLLQSSLQASQLATPSVVCCSTLLLVLCSFSGHTLNIELAGLEGDSSLKLLSKYAVVVDLVGIFVAWVQICKRYLKVPLAILLKGQRGLLPLVAFKNMQIHPLSESNLKNQKSLVNGGHPQKMRPGSLMKSACRRGAFSKVKELVSTFSEHLKH